MTGKRAAKPAQLLAEYKARRDFARTPEPRDRVAKGKPGTARRFVVQKHDATWLHWDFRLELDGVLKSWAVTRGPSANPADKRLAVRTEDHPLDYATFEGVIPAGEYGGGTVMLWDHGTWEPIAGKSADDLAEGHLHFVLHGQRMKGEWLLIRLKPRSNEKRENWLLRKIDDAFTGSSDDLTERALTSVSTGRSMHDIAAGTPAPLAKARKPRGKRSPPKFAPVQLATLVDAAPEGPGWLHETKYDGYRALIACGGGKAVVYTRSGHDWTDKFPEIASAAGELGLDGALIDGEIVALDHAGTPSFSALQEAISGGGTGLHLFAFDLLQLGGEDLRPLPNLERKARLQAALAGATPPLHYAEHVLGSGAEMLRALCGAEMEGIVSKRAEAPYRGKRSQAWLKSKCIARQEFVILGWTRSAARGRAFAALLLGRYEEGALRYSGKVGTGFDGRTLKTVAAAMAPLAAAEPAAAVPAAARRGAHWLRPELVAEVAFAEFTAEGSVRHARFLGLRSDKPAREVGLEQPVPAPGEALPAITHAERVVFPDTGITKGQLAHYYQQVAPLMLATMAGHPLSLVRCPDGIAGKCFFQKHGAGSLGRRVGSVSVVEKGGGAEDYLCLSDTTGLLECVQMGAIEFHGWGSHARQLEQPDRLVFDLDPDEGLGFAEVRRAAQDLKRHLSDMGLVSFAMLSGGKGLHVIAPLRPSAHWAAVSDFAHRFAQALAAAEPERFVATMSKAKRKGRIFIDWLRNQRGSTAIMPYSVRARPGAPVAAPINWSELDAVESAATYTLQDWPQLIARAQGPALAGWGLAAQTLPEL